MLRTIQYSFPSKADGLEISCLAVVPELERNEKYRGDHTDRSRNE